MVLATATGLFDVSAFCIDAQPVTLPSLWLANQLVSGDSMTAFHFQVVAIQLANHTDTAREPKAASLDPTGMQLTFILFSKSMPYK